MKFQIRLKSKFKYLYVCILIFYAVLFVFFKPKPKLKFFSIEGSLNQSSNYKLKNNLPILNPQTNKVTLGKTFLIKDNENWYQIIQLSFWRKKYLSLDFLNNQLKIFDIDLKITNNNNYALGTLQGEKIVYSCMKNSNEFNYIIPEKIVDSFDINYWKKVYIENLKLVFYSFRPKNYECFLVLTNNIKFFENSDTVINKKIFNKFIYE